MKFKTISAGALAIGLTIASLAAAVIGSGAASLAGSPPVVTASQGNSSATTEPAFVDTSSGPVFGYVDRGVSTFRGIPYATAERFERAQPVTPWEDPYPALTWGENCPISANDRLSGLEFTNFSGSNLPQNEDCLFANVWSKETSPDAKKPVVIYIHGGGFSTGSSNQLEYHDGRNLAATGDAVVVSVNHRLNVLGYLDLSEFGDKWADTGNLGQLDLISSLEWVQENIASFGGDPNNVTLVGQSGGGGKILSLMGMPEADGLFDKAWLASAAPAGRDTETAQAQSRALMRAADVRSPEELAALSYLSILEAGRAGGFSPSPVTGTAAYPEPTYTPDDGFVDQAADVPIVVTTTLGEFASNIAVMTSFIQDPSDPMRDNYRPGVTDARVKELIKERFGDDADDIVRAFTKAYPRHDVFDVLWMETGDMFGGPRDQILSSKAEQGGAAVYGGVFAKNLPVFGGVTPGHTVGDVPFLLRNDNMLAHLTAGEEKQFARYAEEVSGSLLRFAATGDPGSKRLKWPEYTADTETLMVFDQKSGARDHHEQELYRLFAKTEE